MADRENIGETVNIHCPVHGCDETKQHESHVKFIEPVCRSSLICIAFKRSLREIVDNPIGAEFSTTTTTTAKNEVENHIKPNVIVLVNENTQTENDNEKDEDSSLESEYLEIPVNLSANFDDEDVNENVNDEIEEKICDLAPCSGDSNALTFIVESHNTDTTQDVLIPNSSTSIAFICGACANKSTHSVLTFATEQHSSIQSVSSDEKILKGCNFEDIDNSKSEENGTNLVGANQSYSKPVEKGALCEPENSNFCHILAEDICNARNQETQTSLNCDCLSCNHQRDILCNQPVEAEPNSSNSQTNSVIDVSESFQEDLQQQSLSNTPNSRSIETLNVETDEEKLNEQINSFVEEFKASHRLERLEERIKIKGERIFSSLQNSPAKSQTKTFYSLSPGRSNKAATRFGSCIDFKSSLNFTNPFSSLILPSSLATSCPASIHTGDDEDTQTCNNTTTQLQDTEHNDDKTLGGKLEEQQQQHHNIQTVEEDFVKKENSIPLKDKNSNLIFASCSETQTNDDDDECNVFQAKAINSPSESTSDSEICKIFYENHQEQRIASCGGGETNNSQREKEEEEESSFSNCEFSVNNLEDLQFKLSGGSDIANHHQETFECYDELLEELENAKEFGLNNLVYAQQTFQKSKLIETPDSCYCSIEAVPLYHTLSAAMRETNGTLRGLLKKPNRPPPSRKNRVVFDETRNQFFEADYIILIREDCPYDEEDEEPCTCGEHELVRICCDEGCNCTYSDDGRTPPVSQNLCFIFK